jgi:hypothetical protein
LLAPLLMHLAELVPVSQRPCAALLSGAQAPEAERYVMAATGAAVGQIASMPPLVASVEATGPRPYLTLTYDGSNVWSLFLRIRVRFINDRPVSIENAAVWVMLGDDPALAGYSRLNLSAWYQALTAAAEASVGPLLSHASRVDPTALSTTSSLSNSPAAGW